MNRQYGLLFMLLFVFAAISQANATITGNTLVNSIIASTRVDSWPGQPTYPIPPEYPGNPSYPGYPGSGSYETSDQLYSNGIQSFNRGDYYSAIQTFRRFLDRFPYEYRAGDVCYMTAQSYQRISDFGSALVFYRRVSSQYSSSSSAEQATYFIGFCLVKLYDYYSAINEFRNFTGRYPYSQLVDDAWYVMGLTYEKLNDSYNAIIAYQKVVNGYPYSNYYNEAKQRLAALQGSSYPGYPSNPPGSDPVIPAYPGNQNSLSDYELYNRGHSQFVSGNYSTALSYFNELLKRYPSSQYADDANFWIARIKMQQKDYQQAINSFESFLRNYPGSEYEPEAAYTLAQAEKELARTNASYRDYFKIAASHFIWFQQNWPGNSYAAEALFQAGDCFDLYGDYYSGRNYYQQLIQYYPYSPAATKAKEKLAGRW